MTLHSESVTDEATPTEAPEPFADQLSQLASRRAAALAMGGPEKIAKQRANGRLDARQRLDVLFDEGTFREYGMHGRSVRPEDLEKTPADGKVMGVGRVDGRPVAAISNDFTVKGASSSATNGQKIMHTRRMADKYGMPVVFLAESAGARMPDRMGAAGRAMLGSDPHEYLRIRQTPWVSALLGPSFGSAAWYAAMSDFVVMRRDAVLAVASPRVINGALGSTLEPSDLGGPEVQAKTSGLVDEVVDTDEEAIAVLKRFLDLLPSHTDQAPPVVAAKAPKVEAESMLEIIPEKNNAVYDGHKVLDRILDADSFVEMRRHVGRSLITGLGRLDGKTVGVICSSPIRKGGAIDVDGCKKAARLLTLCDSFNVPLITFVDTPGFLIGLDGEKRGALAHIMNWMNALSQFSMPKLSVIMRKSYGQAYLNMGGGRNSDEIALWPTADLGFMDPKTGAAVIGGDGANDALADELRRDTGPWGLAEAFKAQDVIDPRETRTWLAEALGFHSPEGRGQVGKHLLASWPTIA